MENWIYKLLLLGVSLLSAAEALKLEIIGLMAPMIAAPHGGSPASGIDPPVITCAALLLEVARKGEQRGSWVTPARADIDQLHFL